MAGNDKAIRAFLRGAFTSGKWCMLFVLVLYVAFWFAGFNVVFLPRRAESVLWIAPWLLAGGLFGLAKHFSKERPVQFRGRPKTFLLFNISRPLAPSHRVLG